MGRQRGFTLVELVMVIIILGVLAAIALPKFIDLGSSARIASLKTMAGAMRSQTNQIHSTCTLIPGCDYTNSFQYVTIQGQGAVLNYGWLDAGDYLGTYQIDAWVNYTGYTPVLADAGATTRFTLDGAPDPSNCYAYYTDAFHTAGHEPNIGVTTSGC